MTTMIQDKDGVIAAVPSNKPSDRHFRNAWVFDSSQSAITEDLTAAKEIFKRSKASFIEPYIMLQNINFNEPEIFKHISIYLTKRNLNNNFVSFLP